MISKYLAKKALLGDPSPVAQKDQVEGSG